MQQDTFNNNTSWDEQSSRTFIDFGYYFVPEREFQILTLCALVPTQEKPFHVIELCCGEGLLAGALLERHPNCIVHGLDGSPEMLQHAVTRLAQYGERFTAERFDLSDRAWRNPAWSVHAVVSSLAIHHLDAQLKRELFHDIYQMLNADGVLIIADMIQPVTQSGVAFAAQSWDNLVRQQALEIDGNTRAFDCFQQEQWNHYQYPHPIDKPSGLFEQLKWLEQVGFVDVDVFWMKAGHAIFGGRKASDGFWG